ncbi:MAG: class I SAM-dependent methyltransferase [Woeseiaceae bacterium]|nr:class I SAM-dependent methyltransferase [Woeseiaceae bacterium]
MTPDEIASSYDQLADHWNSDAFPRSNGIAQHERAIAFAEQRGNAIDIGCGSSGRIIDLLIDNGFSVEGLDISPRMLELARRRHPDVEFHLADIRNWPLSTEYDFISAWDSIWHVPLADQEPVLTKILQGLKRGGVCIFTTGGLDAAEEKTDTAMGLPMHYSVLGIPRMLEVISESQCVCRHLEYDQYPELHVYVIVQRV